MKYLSLLLFTIMFLASCAKKQNDEKRDLANVFYNKAFDYRDIDKTDSAFKYFNLSKELYLIQNDSLGVAKSLANMGYMATLKSDYSGAQDFSLQALNYFNKKIDTQFKYINANYNNLGKATYLLKDYNNSIKFYDLAIVFSTNQFDTQITLNNKAKIYQEIKEYDKALKIHELVLKGTKLGSKEYARSLTNISLTKWLKDPNYNPVTNYLTALRIREKENDIWGLNSSYIHLAEFYTVQKPDSAIIYTEKAYQVAQILNSPNDKLYALQLLINLSEPKLTKKYFEIYKTLDDSVQNVLDSDKKQFAIIRYDFEKSRADNLILQKDNANKKYQIIKREVLFVITLLVLIAASIIAILWYKKRKQKIELETQNTIRENQLKTSKKVHDIVANGLYRVMTEIDNQDEIDKEAIVDRLDDMYQKSRDISYEVEELKPKYENFHAKITDLLNSFITKNTTVIIKGNSPDLWLKVSIEVKHEIENILQELMVNMKKHSHATKVDVLFKQKENHIHITYVDNGIGMTTQPQFKNGLSNTGNRIKHIEGEIIFDTKLENGLKILISFPIA